MMDTYPGKHSISPAQDDHTIAGNVAIVRRQIIANYTYAAIL